jgi:uncharacterized protein
MKTILVSGHCGHLLEATLYRAGGSESANSKMPRQGILFLHGWGSSQDRFRNPATRLAALGFTCLTLDLGGHGKTEHLRHGVTGEQNLEDAKAAYEALSVQPQVAPDEIGVVGSSWGGFLAVLLADVRPVRWLALRSPALYRDSDFNVPKHALDRDGLMEFRHSVVTGKENRALAAASNFTGSVLLIESEHDVVIPPRQILNYANAFRQVASIRRLVIPGADHGLSQQSWRDAVSQMLVDWLMSRNTEAETVQHSSQRA